VNIRSVSAILLIAMFAVSMTSCGQPQPELRALSDSSTTATAEHDTVTPSVHTPSPETSHTGTPTPPADTQTPAPTIVNPTSIAITTPEGTATVPPPCRKITFSPDPVLTNADLAIRSAGTPVRKPFLGVNIVIRKIGVDAPLVTRTVGPDGKMPDPASATDVVWYDFSQWPTLGGTPGTDAGNVVLAGNYDWTYAPQAVFYRVSELVPGDLIQINTSDGRTLAYAVEFNKTTKVDAIDWSALVTATPEESITLITAAAPRNVDRRIVWGRAVTTACS
jgi:hypothetical protein